MLNWLYSFTTQKQNISLIKAAFTAVKYGQLKDLQNLLERGVSANSRNTRGLTLLHMCILTTTEHNEEYMLPLTALLISYDADVNACYTKNDETYGPLHSAVRRKIPLSTKLLLENNADLFMTDKRNKTPLDYANDAEFGNDRGEVIRELLQEKLPRNTYGLS